MAKIHIHPSLQRFTHACNEISLAAHTVADLLSELNQQQPTLTAHILTEKGDLRPYVNLYINGKNTKVLAPDTPVNEDDDIEIITALAGG